MSYDPQPTYPLREDAVVDGVGVAVPGPFDYAKGVCLLTHKLEPGAERGSGRSAVPACRTGLGSAFLEDGRIVDTVDAGAERSASASSRLRSTPYLVRERRRCVPARRGLQRSGVEVEAVRIAGAAHGFFSGTDERATRAQRLVVAALGRAFGGAPA